MMYRTTCFFWERAGNGRSGRICTHKSKEFEAENDGDAIQKHRLIIGELTEEEKRGNEYWYEGIDDTWLQRIDVPHQEEKTTFLGR